MKTFEILIEKDAFDPDYQVKYVKAKDLSDLRRQVFHYLYKGKTEVITVVKNSSVDYGVLYVKDRAVRWATAEGPTPKNNYVSAKTGRMVSLQTYLNDLQIIKRRN